jgi:disulfide bond formation protein DsbB
MAMVAGMNRARLPARLPALVAAAGSAALLGGAFAFQYIGGLQPCALCLWQRWPHAAAIAVGLLVLAVGPRRWLLAAGLLAALVAAGLGVYHAGVEQLWWAGPQTCAAMSDIGGMSAGDLLAQIEAAPVVRCTDIAWSMAGLSMAAWNAVLSALLAGFWAYALTRAP